MSQPKIFKEELSEASQESSEAQSESPRSEFPESTRVREKTRENLFHTIPLQRFSPKDLLRFYSLEYQQISALYDELAVSENLNFPEMKRKALNIIDEHFDVYRKQFSLPDELISMPIQCSDRIYYLSLLQGYLCFYQSIAPGPRIALRLVDRPKDHQNRQRN